MVTLQAFHGLKNNVCGQTSSNNINFGVMADRLCAYFDDEADVRQRNSALVNIILISILISILAYTTDNGTPDCVPFGLKCCFPQFRKSGQNHPRLTRVPSSPI